MTDPATERPRVSLILAIYNPGEELHNLLSDISRQQNAPPFELIAVDSSEIAREQEILERYPAAHYVHLESRAFPGAASNVGIEHATGELFAFLDADLRLPADYVRTVWDLAGHPPRPTVGALLNGTPWHPVGTVEYYLLASDYLPGCPEGPRSKTAKAGLVLPRRTVEVHGGFDGTLEKGSDTELAQRLWQASEPIHFNRRLYVHHTNRRQLRPLLRNQYQLGVGVAQVRKYGLGEGRWLVRYPWLARLLPFYRLLRITMRIARYHPRGLPEYLLSLPLMLPALVAFSQGVIDGSRREPQP